MLATAANAENDTPSRTGQTGGESFVEDFDNVSARRWYTSHGWTNGAHQACIWSKRNISLDGKALVLSLTKDRFKERDFSCAEIQTKERFGYGTYEVRMRAADAPGVVSAFFTFIGPDPHKVPHNEIDFEFLGKDTRKVQLNYFADGKGKHEHMVSLGFDAATTAADYAFEWLPDRLRWYVNGELVHEVKRSDDEPFPDKPQKIYLSIWNAEGLDWWTGRFTDPGKPLRAVFERVAFTKQGENCQFPESVVCAQSKSQ